MSKWLRTATVIVSGTDARSLARRTVADDRADVTRTMHENERRRDVEMERRMSAPHLLLGTTKRGRPYVLGLRELESLRGQLSGQPGNGKTVATILLLAWVCTRALTHGDVAGFGLSVKSDLADGVLLCLGRALERMPRAERRQAFRRIQVFKPFERVRGWALLEPQPGVSPITHASVVGEALMSVKGARLGEVQQPTLHALLVLAITLNWSLVELLLALSDPSIIVRAAERCPVIETRIFLTQRFARLGRGVADGIASRLRSLLATDALRAVFSRVGPPFDVRRGFEPGSVTLVSTGGAELGSESASLAMSAIVLATGVGYAIADPARRADAPVVAVIDEAHHPASVPSAGEALQAAYSRGRAFKISPVVVTQGESQLDARMREVLDATVTFRMVFAGSRADMESARALVAPTGAVARSRKVGEFASSELALKTDAEELASLVRELHEMRPRQALVRERYAPFRSEIIRTADLRIPRREDIDPEVLAELDECAGLRVADATVLVRAQEESALARLGLGGAAPTRDLAAPPVELHRAPRDRGPKGGAL